MRSICSRVGPVQGRRPNRLNGLNALSGVNGRTEIVLRTKERIIARHLNEPRYLRKYRRGERRRQDQRCAEQLEAGHLYSPASGPRLSKRLVEDLGAYIHSREKEPGAVLHFITGGRT